MSKNRLNEFVYSFISRFKHHLAVEQNTHDDDIVNGFVEDVYQMTLALEVKFKENIENDELITTEISLFKNDLITKYPESKLSTAQVLSLSKTFLDFLISLYSFTADGEIELDSLKIFLDDFENPSNLNIISVGCYGISYQQIYEWLPKFCSENSKAKVNISLFDGYFFTDKDQTNEDENVWLPFESRNKVPEFFGEQKNEWLYNSDKNSFIHNIYNIQVKVFKGFPGFGFCEAAKIFICETMKELILDKIANDEVIIISQHTGGAKIDDSLIDLYDLIVSDIGLTRCNENFILFGENKMVINNEPTDLILQYCGNGYKQLKDFPFPFNANDAMFTGLSGQDAETTMQYPDQL